MLHHLGLLQACACRRNRRCYLYTIIHDQMEIPLQLNGGFAKPVNLTWNRGGGSEANLVRAASILLRLASISASFIVVVDVL